MKHKTCIKMLVFIISILFISTIVSSQSITNILDSRTTSVFDDIKEGYILYSPIYDATTYLINETGVVNHTWHSNKQPTLESYMVENGSIIRSIWIGRGGFQQITWDDTIFWEYQYTRDSSYYSHDIVPLPNGDVIMLMQEVKSRAQAIQAGRNPNHLGSDFCPDFLIQVHKTGPTSGKIVWEWHIWDHLIQDYDETKDNYGDIYEHPELIDINFGDDFTGDWIHMNSVDYNPKFDQILMSAHNFNEVWIIDHNTTTEEAASHEGGQHGHGGDLLYRWGNPQAYDHGTADDEKLYFQHQCTWIKPGLPGAGNILVFSNGNNRPLGPRSTADEFTPDVNNETGEYNFLSDGTYGPDDLTWQFLIPQNLYCDVWSGVQRMINGDTLICAGTHGTFIRVTPDKQVVWSYVNPYPNFQDNGVYKIEYIPPYIPPPPIFPYLDCVGDLSWSNIKPGITVYGSFQVQNVGDNGSLLNWSVNNTLTWGTWILFPSNGTDLKPEDGLVTVQVSVIVPKEIQKKFIGEIKVINNNNSSNYNLISVLLTTSRNKVFNDNLLHSLLDRFPFLQKFIRRLG